MRCATLAVLRLLGVLGATNPGVSGAPSTHQQPNSRRDSESDATAVVAAAPVAVAVDVSSTGELELPRFFQSTGFTPSAFLLTEQGRLNMLMAHGGGYRFMRVHCMLDLIDISSAPDDDTPAPHRQSSPSQPRANYSRLDAAFDAIVHVSSCGAAPLPCSTFEWPHALLVQLMQFDTNAPPPPPPLLLVTSGRASAGHESQRESNRRAA
jgi:hypothetical protein